MYRISVLIIAAATLLTAVLITSDVRHAHAQTTIDYDKDDDNLIEVSTANQLLAIHHDLDGDGNATTLASIGTMPTWASAFPNAIAGAGCPARDHDGNPATPDRQQCIGYELVNDISFASTAFYPIGMTGKETSSTFTAKFVGNGFHIQSPSVAESTTRIGLFSIIGNNATVEGVGLIDPNFNDAQTGDIGGITGELHGKVIGSFVQGGDIQQLNAGGITSKLKTGSNYAGLIAHSYVRTTGIGSINDTGGLISSMDANNGSYSARCLNSYFSGGVKTGTGGANTKGLIVATRAGGRGTIDNCYGDNTTDPKTKDPWDGASASDGQTYTRSKAQLSTPAGYTGPFANWDDYAADGTALASSAPRSDFWYFGDSNNLPVLKAWGHDRTTALQRTATTVNLCSRTLPVANEIIRHLKDNIRKQGVTSTPADVTALTPCTATTDTRNVSVTNLANLVVTTPTHTFNLRPDRTFPAADRLNALDINDFAYLTGVTHIDLSDNEISSLPPRIFQGLPLRWLDLSDNELTTLPADLFAGLANVTATTGNILNLSGNTLTHTGIADRVFDPLTHINGLNLSHNSITQINTRWFEQLINLGRKHATEFTPGIGLHLEGNVVARQFYSNKLFSGVKSSDRLYRGQIRGSTILPGGNLLRNSIIQAIDDATTSHANLDLNSTTYYVRSGGTTGYGTTCANTATAGPSRYRYPDGTQPACYQDPHWSPPHHTHDSQTATPTAPTVTGGAHNLTLTFNHTQATSFVTYQARHRLTPSDSSAAWTESWYAIPITRTTANNKTVALPIQHPGIAHQIEFRTLTTAGPPSEAATATGTPANANYVTGFSADPGTSALGTITLSWNTVSQSVLPSGYSAVAFYYRIKKQSATSYGDWTIVPDSADAGTSLTDETSLTISDLAQGTVYDFQFVVAVDNADSDSAADSFSSRVSDSAAAAAIPSSLTADAGTLPGRIDVSWTAQAFTTNAQAKFQIRRKRKTGTWPATAPNGWADIPSSGHSTTSHTITGLTPGAEYDIEVRFHWDNTIGVQTPQATTATAAAVPVPQGLTATTSTTNIRTIDLSWTALTADPGSQEKYQVRYKLTSAQAYGNWSDISGSNYQTNSHSISGLTAGASYDFQIRLYWDSTLGTSDASAAATANAAAVPTPTGFTATTGTSPGSVSLSWTAVTGATGYRYRSKLASAQAYAAAWTSITGTSVTVTGITHSVSHNFQLQAVATGVGNSGAATATANAAAQPPPRNFSVAKGTNAGEFDLTWDAPTAGTVTRYEYRYRRAGNPYPAWTQIPDSTDSGTSQADETSYTITGTLPGSTYDIQLQVVTPVGATTAGTIARRSTRAEGPTNFAATRGSEPGEINISWAAPTGLPPGDSVVNFEYRTKTTAGTNWSFWSAVPDSPDDSGTSRGDETSYTIANLAANTPYDIRLRAAVDDADDADANTDYFTNFVVLTSQQSGIASPDGLQATASTTAPGALAISWTQQTDFGATYTAAEYQIRHKKQSASWPATSPYGWATISGSSHSTTSHSISNLENNQPYNVELRFQPNTQIGLSGAATAVGTSSSVATPSGLAATASTTAVASIHLSWTAQTEGTSSEAKYQVRHKLASAAWTGVTWTDIDDGADADSNAYNESSYTITGLTANTSYNVELRFHWSDTLGASAAASATGTSSQVPPPASLTAASGTAPGSVNLTWTAVTNATSYEYRGKISTSETYPASWTAAAGTSTTVTGLLHSREYDFELRAVATGIGNSTAVTASATTTTQPPARNFAAAKGTNAGAISLSWDHPTSGTVNHYEYRIKLASEMDSQFGNWRTVPDGIDMGILLSDETSYTLANLRPNVSYTIELRVSSSVGPTTSLSATQTAQELAAPPSFAAVRGQAPGEIDLSWAAVTGTPVGDTVVKYEYRYKLTSSSTWGSWTTVPDSTDDGTSEGDETSYTITSLTSSTLYDIEIRAVMDDADVVGIAEDYLSETDSETSIRSGITAPASLTATASTTTPGSIVLSWSAQSETTAAAARYEIRYKQATTTWASTPTGWATITGSTHASSAHTLTDLVNGTSYDIQLRFYWGGTDGRSAASAVTQTSSAVAEPADFNAVTSTRGVRSIDLTWTEQTDTTGTEAKHQYRYKLSATPTWTNETWFDVPEGPDTDSHQYNESSFTIFALTANTSYDVQIRFHWSNTIGASTAATKTATSAQVPTPTGLTATAGTAPGSLNLAWTTVIHATSFQYQYKTGSAAYSNWATIPDGPDDGESQGDEVAFTITGLTAGAEYSIQLRAIATSVGNGPAATTTGTAQTQPAPQNFAVMQGANPGELDLSWQAPTAGTVSRYDYQYKLATDTVWSAWSAVPDSPGDIDTLQSNETSYTITSLLGGLSYDVQLRVASTVGESQPVSATQTATNVAAPPSFAATVGSDPGEIDLTWATVTGMPTGDSVVLFEYRHKLNSESTWTSWTEVPDGEDNGNSQADESSYTIASLNVATLYDIELRAAIDDGGDADALTDYHTASASQTSKRSGIATPAGIQTAASTTAPGAIVVSWTAQTTFGATYADAEYQIRHKLYTEAWPLTSPFGWAAISGSSHSTSSHTLTDLKNGQNYNIELRFQPSTAIGASASTATTGTASTVATPTGLTATTASNAAGGITLTWTAQTAGTSSEAKYQVRTKLNSAADWSGATWSDVDDGSDADSHAYNESTHTIAGLTANTSFDVQLRFHWSDAVGASAPASATATSSVVPIPASFSASAGTAPGSVNLTWAAVTGASYEISFKLTSDPNFGTWASAGSGTSFTVSSLSAGANYSFQLRAVVTGVGTSGTTSTTGNSQTQPAPQNFAVAQGSDAGQLALSWAAPTAGTVTRYEFRYKLASAQASEYTAWTTVPDSDSDGNVNDETAHTISSLLGGISYNVQLRVISSVGMSQPETQTQTAKPVTAPASFIATIGSNPGEINLSWAAVSGMPTGDTVQRYEYRYKLNSDTNWGSWTEIPDSTDSGTSKADETAYTLTSLTVATLYDIELRAAIDDGGDAGTDPDYESATANQTAIRAGIAAPASLTAAASTTTAGSIVLSWTQQTTFGATYNNAEYEIRSKLTTESWPVPSPYGWAAISSSSHSTNSHTLTNLANGKQYNIQLRFKPSTAIGVSASTAVTGTASTVATPTGFSAATSTTTVQAINLVWTAQTDTTGSEATYQVRHRAASTADWTGVSWTNIPDGGDNDSNAYNESTYTITGLTANTSYHVQLRFHWSNAIGASAATSDTATSSQVPAPTSFSASNGTAPGSIDLSWTGTTGATSYQYQHRTGSNAYSGWTTIQDGPDDGTSQADETSFTITGLTAGASYSIQLRAVATGVGNSPATTDTATAQTQPGPQTFTAAQGTNAGEIDLSWTAPTSGNITRYEFRYKLATTTNYPATWTPVPDQDTPPNNQADETSYTITSLLGGLSYNVQLRVISTVGESLPTSATQTATNVAAPPSFSATIGSDPGEIDLAWSAATGMPTGDAVVRYEYRYKLTSGSTWQSWTPVPDGGDNGNLQSDETSYTITSLTAATLYDIDLRAAIDDGGDADALTDYYSSSASQTSKRAGIDSPASLRATTSSTVPGSIVLNWTQQTTFGATYNNAQYQIRTKLTTASWPGTAPNGWAAISGSSHSTNSHTLTNLENGKQYNIELRFRPNATIGVSATSAVTGTASSVSAPSSFTATTSATVAGSINLSWTAQTTGTSSEAKYQVRHKLASANWASVSWTDIPDGSDADSNAYNESSYTIGSLTAGASYNIQLRFHWSDAIGPSAAVSATANAATVPTPASFSASSGTNPGTVDLTWAAVTNATYEYAYRLTTAPSFGTWTAESTTSATVTGLAAGSNYTFQLRALVSGVGTSTITTTTATAQTQAAPRNFAAAQGTNAGELDLSWLAPTVGTVTRFEYRYKLATVNTYPATWQPVPDQDTPPDGQGDETSYTLTSLLGGLSYNVQLRVVSSVGESQPVAQTQTATPVAAPASFTATIGSNPGEIDLAWATATGMPTGDSVVRYEYRYKLSSGSNWQSWSAIPDGADSGNSQGDETSYTIANLTAGTQYDIDLRAAIDDGGDADSAHDYHSTAASQTNSWAGIASPANLRATASTTTAGSIALSWNQQTTFGATYNNAEYQIRTKLASASWPGSSPFGWAAISTSSHSTNSHTLTDLASGQSYNIELRFEPASTIGVSAATAVTGSASAVSAPSGFSAAASSTAAGAIDLSWTAQTAGTSSEAKYQVRHKLASASWSGVTWTNVPDGSDSDSNAYNESSHTIGSLTAGASYNVQLRFHWSDAIGPSTAVSQTATASTVPTPATFSASSGTAPGSVDLSWSAVTSATYQYSYRLSSASSFGSWSSEVSGTSATVTGLTAGSNYTFQLRAVVSGVGNSPPTTDTATAQTQSAPQNYAATQGTNAGEINLSWQAPASGTVVRYEFRYKLATTSNYPGTWTPVPDGSDGDSLQSNETSYTITSLLGGLSYNVQLQVVSSVGTSQPVTQTSTATPVAAPTNFTATIGTNPGTISLSWTALATSTMPSGDSVTQYQYRSKLTSATSYSSWTNIPTANTSSYTITGLTASTLYDIQLRAAIDDGGDAGNVADYHSNAASQTSIRSGLASPAGLRAVASTSMPGAIVLSWTAQSTFTDSTAQYQVRRKLQSATWAGATWTNIPDGSDSDTNAYNESGYILTGLTNGQRYDIQLRFYVSSALGNSAATSAVGTASNVPVPTGFTATTSPSVAGAISLTWTAQTDTTGSEAKYQRRHKLASASWTSVTWTDISDGSDSDNDAHNESAYSLTGLTTGATYNIQLRFHWSDAIGPSAAVTASASASDVPTPGNFSASTGSAPGAVDLSWNTVTDATYEYRYRLTSSATFSGWTPAGSGTTHTVTGLAAGSNYRFELRAVISSVGNSPAATDTARAQTQPGPRTFAATQGTNPGDLALSWQAPASGTVTRYEYRHKLATASTYTNWSPVPDSTDSGTSQGDETSYTIADLLAGMSYNAQLRAVGQAGTSLPVVTTGTTTAVPPPTSLSASGGTNPGEVNLSWTAPAGITVLRYEARHRLGTTGTWSSWTSAGTSTTHSFTGLLAGQSRTFEVRAVMQTVGASAAASTTGTPTPVPTPTSLTASTGTFPGEIDIAWAAVTGATSYEYRYRLTTATWPEDSTWTTVQSTQTSATLTVLDEGAAYVVELRAAITNVGKSTAASVQGTARSGTFEDPPVASDPGDSGYEITSSRVPGRISIILSGDGDPFIYRYRTANPGEWSRWFTVMPASDVTEFVIPDLTPGVEYEVQMRVLSGTPPRFSPPLSAIAQVTPLVPPEGFDVSEDSGTILLTWNSPSQYDVETYEYRTRPTGTADWSDWVEVQHAGNRGSVQRRYVTGLESGIKHDFQIRITTQAGPSPTASGTGGARLRIAEIHSIKPVVRSINVRAGDTIALTVDIYDSQQVLDNSIPQNPDSKLVFAWNEEQPGGGSFGNPSDERRVTYTVPSAPGVYTVTAEAQPDGICLSHHASASEITTPDRAPCIATFTVRATAVTTPTPRPDPVNPVGAIPTSLTDREGTSYAVFTPADGGTFNGTDITVTANEGAVPDRTLLGISATKSNIKPPAPVPGATMSVSGNYYEVNAIRQTGEPPVSDYTLDNPITACLPFPDEFRADLSNVVTVQRQLNGNLAILSTKIRSINGNLTVCGAISKLPATIGIARLGTVPTPTQTPTTEINTPDTGATTPSQLAILATLLIGATLTLTAISRIVRIRKPNRMLD